MSADILDPQLSNPIDFRLNGMTSWRVHNAHNVSFENNAILDRCPSMERKSKQLEFQSPQSHLSRVSFREDSLLDRSGGKRIISQPLEYFFFSNGEMVWKENSDTREFRASRP